MCFKWVINVFNSYFPIANVYFDIQIVCDLNGMQSKLNNIWMQSSSSSYYLHLFKVSLSYLKLLGKHTPDKLIKNGKSTFYFYLFSSTGKSSRWKNVNEKLKFNAILYFWFLIFWTSHKHYSKKGLCDNCPCSYEALEEQIIVATLYPQKKLNIFVQSKIKWCSTRLILLKLQLQSKFKKSRSAIMKFYVSTSLHWSKVFHIKLIYGTLLDT